MPVSKQQHISQEQQVRPTSEASRDSHPHINAPRPVPQHVNSVGRDIRVAGGATHKLAHKKQLRARTAKSATTGQQERESYVADESGAISAALAGASSSSATTEKKELKRAANRRSAQLSRKRKKHFIEELKDENDELKRKERILRSIPDLIVVFDSAGRLGFVSDSVSNFLDCSPSDLEGTSFWHRLCDESVKLLKAAFMDALAARRAGVDTSPLGDGLWVLRLKSTNGSQKLVILNGVVHFSGEKPECVCSIRPKYNHKTSVKNTCGGENVILRHMDTASEGEDTDTAEANIKPQQSVVSGSSDDSLLAVIGKRHKVPNVSLRNRSRVAAQISDGESLSEAGSDYR